MKRYETEVKLHNIFTSPAHNYFTREKFDVGTNPTIMHTSVLLEKNKGLCGDRFEHATYPITFFSLEVAKEVCNSLKLELDLKLFRRNFIISGINLNELIGKKFLIGDVEFEGLSHCAPCPWMNAVMKKGAYTLMIGRGGLRAKVIQGGILELGEQVLMSENRLTKNPLEALSKAIIP
ncbi:MAG: hypothetical protein FP820_01020 [Sulfurimonas sp.]|nr:hypothetical protein [Sulfurimonas sp.]MBU3938825.1 hypothetical protein [bacterium]MBU4024987.1 hypothetical protein [bacterium]MBU4059453.1 hypothetical protein [bacterium]MBU4110177.1 hypothetical protein [bacterium]